jgi:transcriptional regulator of acetoin/glycerol metabolism
LERVVAHGFAPDASMDKRGNGGEGMSRRVEAAERAFIEPGVDAGVRSNIIALWHQRSRELGLQEGERADHSVASRSELSGALEQNRLLYAHALPVMETLHEQIVNTHSMVILTDDKGLILHAMGDEDFLERADRVALRTGAVWSEQSKGTNAIGTALTDMRPTLVHANEHFLAVNRVLTCSCSPILDPYGRLIGALDVSGNKDSYHAHTMALVRMSAQMIENHLFADAFGGAIRVHFHARPEFIGTLVEGIVAFGGDGRFLAANRSAQAQLGLSIGGLQTHTLSSLFGVCLSTLFDHYRTAGAGLLSLCLHNGVRVHARAELRARATAISAGVANESHVESVPLSATKTSPRRSAGMFTLRDLNTGDPNIANVIERIGKVQRHEIPILILGETGTGKELLAQAIHNESPRRQRPFVAVNCASIPETLIEAELFGYEEGAFTGARKKGSVGKMLVANGGTLFLDEIGDMPLNLQARLLRVLQERVVTPLGSTKAIPVNVAVICATNRNLRAMISRGEFREDLYYRLNGLVVKLPPLRNRMDLDTVIERILRDQCECPEPVTVSADVLDLFRRYGWPGNIRQLSNLLRTACIMAQGEGMIQVHHLPEDFLEDLRAASSEPSGMPTESGSKTANSSTSEGDCGASEARSSSLPVGAASVCSSDRTAAMGQDARWQDLEVSVITAALKRHNGNVSAAARALGISRNTIYRKVPASAR